MWFVPWLSSPAPGCLMLGSCSHSGHLVVLEPTLVILASGAFALAFLLPENMPLEMKFFPSFYHLLCVCWVSAHVPKIQMHPEKSVLQESRRGPCPHGTHSLLREPDNNHIITSWMPDGHCDKAGWWQVELYEVAAAQSFLSLIGLNRTRDPEVTEGSRAERSIWCKWYFRTINLVLL